MTTRFTVIAAMDRARGISKLGAIPWRLASDIERMRSLLTDVPDGRKNAVILDEDLHATLVAEGRLPRGPWYVLVTTEPSPSQTPNGARASDLASAIAMASARGDVDGIFVIGGAGVFADAVRHPGCSRLEITSVDIDASCDAFFPEPGLRFTLTDFETMPPEGGLRCSFKSYVRTPPPDRRRR